MPQPVGQLEEPHAVVGGDDVAVFVEVREIGHAGAEPLLAARPHMPRRAVCLQFAEMAGEGELLVIGDRLLAEHQHGVTVHAVFDRRDLACVERVAAIDAGDLADEHRMQRPDRYGHAGYPAKPSANRITRGRAIIRSAAAIGVRCG